MGADPLADAEPHGSQLVGDYELLEEIGRGGMGVVWRARQVDRNRIVALKLLLAGPFAAEEARQRFQREAQIVAALRHPNIVAVHEVGEHEGRPYFSMDFIEGQNLATRLRDSLPTARQAAEWMLILAGAVAHAHERGIIHRDIKPANILLDALDAPHLTDFGLAKPVSGANDLTLTGQALGSASYMAPEQASARNADVTLAADIYAFGAVLYHLLTGRPPFLADSVAGTIKLVVETEPLPPSRLNPTVPRDLETICLKCLEKEPGRRYGSVLALAEDLRLWLDQKHIHARPATISEKTGRWVRRNPLVATLGMLLATALLLGLGVTSWQLSRAQRFLGDSQLANQRLTQNLARRDQREAENLLANQRPLEGIAALARLVHSDASNTVASARLFSALARLPLPWPVLPTLVHEGAVQQGAFTADDRFILTASDDGVLHVWDAKSALSLLVLPHDTTRGRFALAGDGRHVATLTTNRTAQVWRLPEGSLAFAVGNLHTELVPDRRGEGSRELDQEAASAAASKQSMSLARPASAAVIAMQFSPDGALLATACGDGVARLWRVDNGTLALTLPDHEPIRLVSFHPDGGKLLTVGATNCFVWDVSSNRLDIASNANRLTLRPIGSVDAAAFSPRGDQLLTVASNHLELWDARSGARLRLIQHQSRVNDAAFSTDGTLVALAGSSNRAQILRVDREERSFTSTTHAGRVNTIRFRPNDSLVLTASDDATAQVWSSDGNRRFLDPMQHKEAVHDAVFNHARDRVLTVSADKTARVWFILRIIQRESRLPLPAGARLLEWSPDGETIAAAGRDRAVRLFGSADVRARGTTTAHRGAVRCLAFTEDNRRIASADESGELLISDARTARTLCGPLMHESAIRQLKWSCDQSHLLAVTETNVWLWQFSGTQAAAHAVIPMPHVQAVDFSPDGRRLVLSAGQIARLFDPRTGQAVGQPMSHPAPIRTVRFSPDGRLVATAGEGNAVRVWTADGGNPVSPFIHPGDHVNSIAFSPDSRSLATGADNGAVSLWDTRTGHARATLFRCQDAVRSVDFSPDGQSLLVAAKEGYIRLLDVESALPIMSPYHARRDPVARFSANGRRLLVNCAGPTLASIKSSAAAVPNSSLLLALTELVLGQRLTDQGGWQDLTTDEFFSRQRLLSAANWRLGPDRQMHIFW